jgi:hypothetical protein
VLLLYIQWVRVDMVGCVRIDHVSQWVVLKQNVPQPGVAGRIGADAGQSLRNFPLGQWWALGRCPRTVAGS